MCSFQCSNSHSDRGLAFFDDLSDFGSGFVIKSFDILQTFECSDDLVFLFLGDLSRVFDDAGELRQKLVEFWNGFAGVFSAVLPSEGANSEVSFSWESSIV